MQVISSFCKYHIIDSLLELYEDGAVLVSDPGGLAAGKPAIREAMLGFLALKPRIALETVPVLEGGGDLAMLESRWVLDGTGPDGNPVQMTGHTREVARRQKTGNWLYVIDDPGVGKA